MWAVGSFYDFSTDNLDGLIVKTDEYLGLECVALWSFTNTDLVTNPDAEFFDVDSTSDGNMFAVGSVTGWSVHDNYVNTDMLFLRLDSDCRLI